MTTEAKKKPTKVRQKIIRLTEAELDALREVLPDARDRLSHSGSAPRLVRELRLEAIRSVLEKVSAGPRPSARKARASGQARKPAPLPAPSAPSPTVGSAEARRELQKTTWSAVRTGRDHGYAVEIETFDSEAKAKAFIKQARAECAGVYQLVRGIQMWNEPVGQVEGGDEDGDAL